MSAIYDNWERLVAAVLKKEQLRQLCHAESIATTTSVASSLAYTSSFSPSVQNAVVSDVTSHHQIPAVKRWRRHRPVAVAPHHQDSYFSYQDEMLVIYEQHQSLRIDQLDWESCLRIAIDVAKAIANHHKMEPLHMDDDIIIISDKNEPTSSIVIPTAGYVAPDGPSKASDVYSFGVLLIELLTGGKLVISRRMLVRWAIHKFHEIGTLVVFEFVPVRDPNKLIEMWKMFLVAMTCVEENPKMRPEMCHVLKMITP